MHKAKLMQEASKKRSECKPPKPPPIASGRREHLFRKLPDPGFFTTNLRTASEYDFPPALPLAKYNARTKMRLPSPRALPRTSGAMDPRELKLALQDAGALRETLMYRRSPAVRTSLDAHVPKAPPWTMDPPSHLFSRTTSLETRDVHVPSVRGLSDWKLPPGQPEWVPSPSTAGTPRSRRPSREEMPMHLKTWSIGVPLTAEEESRQPSARRGWRPAGPLAPMESGLCPGRAGMSPRDSGPQ